MPNLQVAFASLQSKGKRLVMTLEQLLFTQTVRQRFSVTVVIHCGIREKVGMRSRGFFPYHVSKIEYLKDH
jgi:hypothetical protein